MSTIARYNVRSAAAVFACAGMVCLSSQIEPRTASAFGPDETYYNDDYQQYLGRPTIPVTIQRFDFTNVDDGGHPDFGLEPDAGAGRFAKIASEELDADRRPIFNSTGYKILQEQTDAEGYAMAPLNANIDSMPGDTVGQLDSAVGGAVTSANSFGQWFEPTPGVNQWSDTTIDFQMDDNGLYVLEGSLDDLGTGQTTDYTASLGWGFVYEADRDNFLEIETGAEAWVYIDGRLVIDGGGLSDPGLPGGHFDVDVYDKVGTKKKYHEHEYDDKFDVTHLDIANDSKLLYDSIVGGLYPNPVRVVFLNAHNGGGGSYTFDAGGGVETGLNADGFDRVFDASQLIQLRVDFMYLAEMRGTEPGKSQKDPVDRDDAFTVRMTDDTTGDFLYEMAVYQHVPKDGGDGTSGLIGSGYSVNPMPRLHQRIDLSRLSWLQDRTPYRIEVFYANRTGDPSDIRIETNLRTVNVLAHPLAKIAD